MEMDEYFRSGSRAGITIPFRVPNVEQGVVFYSSPPTTSRFPKNQNGTMAKDALLIESFISAERVRSITRLCQLCVRARYYQITFIGLVSSESYVEQGAVFYLKPPATSRSPEKSEWHVGQRRLVNGKVY